MKKMPNIMVIVDASDPIQLQQIAFTSDDPSEVYYSLILHAE